MNCWGSPTPSFWSEAWLSREGVWPVGPWTSVATFRPTCFWKLLFSEDSIRKNNASTKRVFTRPVCPEKSYFSINLLQFCTIASSGSSLADVNASTKKANWISNCFPTRVLQKGVLENWALWISSAQCTPKRTWQPPIPAVTT